MNFKKIMSALFVVLVTLVTIAGASAKTVNPGELPVVVEWVKVDGDTLDTNNIVNKIERNNQYEVKVKLIGQHDPAKPVDELTVLEDLTVEAKMTGYDYNDQIYDSDFESVGSLQEGQSETVTLSLSLPYKLDKGDASLTITVSDKMNDYTLKYVLYVEPEEHSMMIKDVIFSPSSTVVAGRSLLTTVYLKNIGATDDEEGIKVSIEVPALGISAVDYIDVLDEDEATSSEELWLVVPKCTPAGDYDAVVSVGFKDGEKTTTANEMITVLADDSCEAKVEQTQKTVIAVAAEPQEVKQGEGVAIYPLTLTNSGSEDKTYVVEADGYQDWAKVSMSPSSVVVVQSGEAKAVYAYVSALEAAAPGEHMFSLTVKSGSETLKQIPLKANVVAAEKAPAAGKWDSVKKALEIGLIVLIVLLVILGLIIGFNKLKGNDEDEDLDEQEDKNYY